MKHNKQNTNTTYNHSITKVITKAIVKTIINWPEYNRALILRGDLFGLLFGVTAPRAVTPATSGLATAIMDLLKAGPGPSHANGHPKKYSDELITMMLTVRELFHLPLRQTTGFVACLLGSIHFLYLLPDYTTLSRRMKKLEVDFTDKYHQGRQSQKEGIVLLIDSSGFKITGEGEWKVRKHGKDKRRTWTETHLGIDHQARDIVALVNTSAYTHDNTQVEPLLKQCQSKGIKVKIVIGDGAYDAKNTYQLARQYGAKLIAPPREDAVEHLNSFYYQTYDTPGWEERNATVRHIEEYGLDGWMEDVSYHRRSLVENTFYRLKTIFGPSLKSKSKHNQYIEQCIRAKILNHFNSLGLPKYEYCYTNSAGIKTKYPATT